MDARVQSVIGIVLGGLAAFVLVQALLVPTLIEQANSPATRSSPGARPLLLFLATVLDMRFYIPAGLTGIAGCLVYKSGVFRRL